MLMLLSNVNTLFDDILNVFLATIHPVRCFPNFNMKLMSLLCYFTGVFAVSYWLWSQLNPWLFTQCCVIGGLSMLSWVIAYYIYEQLNRETISPHGKAVFITGCDTGFGNQLAKRLDKIGMSTLVF